MSTTPRDPQASTDEQTTAPVDDAAGASDDERASDEATDATVDEASDEAVDEVGGAESAEEQQVNPDDDLRTRKIFELRNKIASGEYEIDPETIARRIKDDI